MNEIAALAKRAARGAGLSWGMAEEAARAARWLASHDLAGPALLSGVLTQNDRLPPAQVAPASLDGEWRARVGDLCPLAAGAALNDHAGTLADGQPIKMLNVSYPLLVLPFAAWAAIYVKQPVQLIWQDVRIETDGDGIWIDDPHVEINTSKTETLSCQLAPSREDAAQRPGQRCTVASDIWARLDEFAQRTYAPATEASRMLGAGAGISDSD
ncbi:DUF3726 domain-containing protein (plasmid) [Phaeobacter inhibens]|nr:DUF3726 domain-containing protein [Phaeobacter inhibens]